VRGAFAIRDDAEPLATIRLALQRYRKEIGQGESGCPVSAVAHEAESCVGGTDSGGATPDGAFGHPQ